MARPVARHDLELTTAEQEQSEPWELEEDGDGYLINGIIRVPSTYEGYTEDAHLIVKAPDLYRELEQDCELLEQLFRVFEGRGDGTASQSIERKLNHNYMLLTAARPT